MNQDLEAGTVISDHRVLSVKTKKLLTIGLLGVGAVVALSSWYIYNNNRIVFVEDFGIDSQPTADTVSNGYIYLSGFTENVGINTFALDLTAKEYVPVTTSGNNWDYESIDESHALFSTSVAESTTENIQIVVADFSSDTYLNVPTPDGFYKRNIDAFTLEKDAIVYSARTTVVGEGEDFFDAQKWSVIYGEPETNQFTTINEAFSPIAIPERNEIMYVKTDGVYVRNYITDETYFVDTGLTNFFAGTEIALAPDRSRLVMTLPADNSIVVFAVNAEEQITLTTEGIIKEENRRHATPVISPDSQFYAVFAYTDGGTTETDVIEVRQLTSREILGTFPVTVVDGTTIRLNEWSETLITKTATEHHADGENHSHSN